MKTRYFKIGVFVLGAATLGVLGIIVFGAGKLYRQKVMVETYIDESVQGLTVGSLVKRRGVEIGTVEEITFVPRVYDLNPSDPEYFQYARYVYIKIGLYKDFLAGVGRGVFEDPRVALENEVANGLTLQLTPLGLTGVAYLEADYLDPEDVPALKIAWLPKNTYIPSTPGTFAQITQTLHKLAKEIKEVDIKAVEGDVRALLQSMLVATQEVNAILKRPDITEILANLRETTKNVSVASVELPETVAQANRTLRRVDNVVSNQQQNLEVIVDDIRLISESLKEVTGDAERYPSYLLFGEPPPRSQLVDGE
jgi:phospholipid/cholesterol/gamma-HCH transport system substrate-binding protein/paraquat-inducible protein B